MQPSWKFQKSPVSRSGESLWLMNPGMLNIHVHHSNYEIKIPSHDLFGAFGG
jgi:hypothetical protein